MRTTAVALVLLAAAAPASAQIGGKIKWTAGKPAQLGEEVAREAAEKTCVYFTARWDPTCKKLDERAFSNEAVVKAAEGWHCVLVDLSDLTVWKESNSRHKLKNSLPTVRFYAKDGALVDELILTTETDVYVRKFQGESLLYRMHPKDKALAEKGDSHRITLRNGNVVDCVLVELTESQVIVMWDKQCEAHIKREDIARIELLRIRPHGEEAAVVGGPVTPPPPGKTWCAACRRAEVSTEGEKCAECVRKPPPSDPTVQQGVKDIVDRLVRKLVDAKRDQLNPDDREPIVEELSRVGTEGLIYAVRVAATADPDIAVWLFAAVSRAKEKGAARAIREQLETSSNAELIVYMINALTQLEDKDAARTLAKVAAHPNPAVRGAAIEGMGTLGNRDSVQDLSKAVVDAERNIRAKATSAIVTLAKKFEIENAAYFAVRTAASNAPEARRDFVPLVCSQLDAKEAIPTLIDYLRSTSADVRANSITALADLGGTDALETFYAMLETETESRVRMLICNALGKMKDTGAIGRLVDLMGAERTEQDVRLAASRALQAITKQKFGPDPDQWRKWWEAQRGVKPEKKEDED